MTDISSFEEIGIHQQLAGYVCKRFSINKPTRIQKQAAEVILNHRNQAEDDYTRKDIVIQSETGSGKTIAYLLPIMQPYLAARKYSDILKFTSNLENCKNLSSPLDSFSRNIGPLVLVILPTQELAVQVFSVAKEIANITKFGAHWLVCGKLLGGESRKSEKGNIRRGLNFIFSTPGRLLDHMRSSSNLKMDHLQWVIFDEADRLHDMGFEKDAQEIMRIIRSQHTSEYHPRILLCSATMQAVKSYASWLIDFENTEFVGADNTVEVPQNLVHSAVIVDAKYKISGLITLIEEIILSKKINSRKKTSGSNGSKIIIFTSTRATSLYISAIIPLIIKGAAVSLLHGLLQQSERRMCVEKFEKESGIRILVATDLIARGIDLREIEVVIHFDPPANINDYIHRAGRTARKGLSGESVLILTPLEREYIDKLKKVSGDISVKVKVEGDRRRNQIQGKLNNLVESNETLNSQAIESFQASVSSYATFPHDLKHIFSLKNLHLGHLASSHFLKQIPRNITITNRNTSMSLLKRTNTKNKGRTEKMNAYNVTSSDYQLI
jgi:ATP-dependent RNA helicase DDX31/DBP7